MKISMNLSAKSVENAIKQLEIAKKQLENEMIYDFLNTCCTFIVDQARNYLMASTIGTNVQLNIMSGWQPPLIRKEGKKFIAKMTNTDSQAVYVEFGVGIVGQQNAHDRVTRGETVYEYNIPTEYKYAGQYHDENTWRFYAKETSDVDLMEGYFEEWQTKDGDYKIITRGSPAVMYAFNACVDLEASAFKTIWEQIKKKYWG